MDSGVDFQTVIAPHEHTGRNHAKLNSVEVNIPINEESMSLRDLEQSRATLVTFKGRYCFLQLATNSIRVRMDDRAKKGCYIWIDPPWVFSREWKEITSSDAYSADTFTEWCRLFSTVRETMLQDFEEDENGAVTLIFSDGHRLFVPVDAESDEEPDPDYDHWYAYDGKNA